MVRGLVQRSKCTGSGSDQGFAADLVARQFPEHGTGKTVVRDVLALLPDHVGGIITDELSLR